MKRAVAALILVTLLGGCSTYQGSKRAAKTGALLTGIGLVSLPFVFVAAIGGGARSGGEQLFIAAVALGSLGLPIGGTLLLGGLVGMAAYDSVPPEQRAAERAAERVHQEQIDEQKQREREHEEARDMRSPALRAMRAGDCSTVVVIAKRIEELDSEYYATELSKDPLLQPCLAPAPVGPDSPPDPAATGR